MSIAPVSAGQISDRAFWRAPIASLLTALGASRTGLTQREAEARLKRFGPNRFDAAQGRPLLTKIATRLLNPLVTILLVAAAVSGFSGDLGSFLIIAAVISFSLTLDIVQEHRAEQSADALRKSVAVHVLQAGITVPVNALVPGERLRSTVLPARSMKQGSNVSMPCRSATPKVTGCWPSLRGSCQSVSTP